MAKFVNISGFFTGRIRIIRKKITSLIFLLGVVTFFSGCMKKESYPDIPQIEFLSYTNVFDTGSFAVKGILNISFRDGNGDIGLDDADTFFPFQPKGPYYYNFIVLYYEKQNGVFQQVTIENPTLNSRIPVLAPHDPGKAVKGTITNTLPVNPHPVHDTIQIKAYIYDRALNKSNMISTPEIILRRRQK